MQKLAMSCALTVVCGLGAWGARDLPAQCTPPAGTYRMFVDPPILQVTLCPGADVVFRVKAATTPAGTNAFGFNLVIECPGIIRRVVPLFTVSPGTGFASHVGPNGNELAAFGIANFGAGPLMDLVEVTFRPQITGVPATADIRFGGDLALPGGIIPRDHLVETSTGCDVLPPLLGLQGARLTKNPCAGNFIRGDCNNNGSVAGLMGDALFLLASLFLDGREPDCRVACDANDNDSLDIDDAIFILNWQLGIGPAPPPPTPTQTGGLGDCGPDPTPGVLTCANHLCP